MSIFGSDRPSGTMGGLLSGLFRTLGGGNAAPGTYPTTARSGGMGRKLATGALLAAGAAYLYNRNKNKGTSAPSFNPNL
ncbi:hypothetical protein E5K00_05745 [Hymenobacter aquaticus]|uniref:Uncharacterized protein n=1 Tax=Hymenobacter aquaticus TaxID=1867101 RepID=A0A4Z0Q7L3_9BACT|nr:hypothetical protein [Hymenobacter aquaticus]TGE24712.1 hypothetical protein E5K00_05745 [Hymenobacter aquaticus]